MKIPTFNIPRQLKHFERLITDNSPMILSGAAVVGTVTTAILAVQAGMKANHVIEDAELAANVKRQAHEDRKVFTKREKAELTWKLYVLPVCSATLTIGCVVGAQTINARRAAAMAGVLALAQDDLKTYKDKVKEKLTGPQNKKLNDEIAQQKFDEAYSEGSLVTVPPGEILAFEPYTGRLFTTTRVALERAEVFMQKRTKDEDSASLSDFYGKIGLDQTAMSDQYGWNTSVPFELEYTAVLTKDETAPAISINYVEPPMFRPWEAGKFR